MLTLRAAAGLLARSDSLLALRDIAQIIGFANSRPLPAHARRELGIDALVTNAELAAGDGRRRCLSAELAPSDTLGSARDARELTRQLCVTLATRAPARDWCVLTLDATRTTLCLATVAAHTHGPRVTALRVDRTRVVDSDADTLRALAAITEQEPALRHARFSDILGRDALSARFYRALEQCVSHLAESARGPGTAAERHELALLTTSRCLFLSFLEAKGWLDHDHQFLLRRTTDCLETGGRIHERFLKPLFFGTLNTPHTQRAPAARSFGEIPFLNGGLFSPTALEGTRRALRFTDDALVALLGGLLDRYRFTAHEESTQWSEAAIDPEMLGRAFESLMSRDERHRSGSYYTPPALVETVVHDALYAVLPNLPADVFTRREGPLHLPTRTRDALTQLRLLDPACGSGAFLVHALESLASLQARAGDEQPTHLIRRAILARSIFGVDRNPMAVWLCELRLWLSIVIECPETRIRQVPPLPNLDHHIRLGDTLAGGTFRYAPPSARRLTALRERYTRATGVRKHTLAAALDREERTRALAECQRTRDSIYQERAALVEALRARDLFGQRRTRTRADTLRLAALKQRIRELDTHARRLALGGALPFRFAAHFADVAASGGFDLVIGNPPWVRPHAVPLAERTRLRQEFRTIRHAAWRTGARRAGAGAGFAAQADLAAAFVERSAQLLAVHGVVALLLPAKLWRALAGGGVREWLAAHTNVLTVRDWTDSPSLFDAAVYPSLMVAARRADQSPPSPTPIDVSIAHTAGSTHFPVARASLSLGADPAAPWLLLPPRVHAAFEYLRTAGPALGDSPLGRPLLGVKCGCNAAFLVHAVEHEDDTATVFADGRRAVIERRLLRPALRGDAVHPLRTRPAREPAREPASTSPTTSRTKRTSLRSSLRTTTCKTSGRTPHNDTPDDGALRIIWTHDTDGAPLRTLPPATARWMAHWRPQLERRRDARARQPWWTLFRTDAARHESPRLVWADIARALRPRVLEPGDPTVPLNSCYVLRTASLDDAWALHALLASPLAAAWFETLAEPARGGFRRYMGWTVATLPVPADWPHVRARLAAFARACAHDNTAPHPAESLAVIAEAYGLSARRLAPLVDWHARDAESQQDRPTRDTAASPIAMTPPERPYSLPHTVPHSLHPLPTGADHG